MAFDMNQLKGRVLRVWVNTSYQIMSDVWGTADQVEYWDDATQRPMSVTLNVYDYGMCTDRVEVPEVDATPEVWKAFADYRINAIFQDKLWRAQDDAKQFVVGCFAKVVAGKTAKGTVGKVTYMMKATYNQGYNSRVETKLCIATSDRTQTCVGKYGKSYEKHLDIVWVWARNAERLDIVAPDEAELKKLATEEFMRNAKTAYPKMTVA